MLGAEAGEMRGDLQPTHSSLAKIRGVAQISAVKRILLRVLRCVALAYVAVILFVAGCQRSMLYFPEKMDEPAAIAKAKRERLEPWRNAKGEIIGWREPNPKARNRMVVFHGNAGSASDRSYYVEGFQSLNGGADWEVFIFEYPGYAARPGTPGKDAFIELGKAALEELAATDKRPLYVLGESIGSGTASAMAGRLPDKVAGCFLIIPFSRLEEVAKARFPFLPIGLLLRDKFDNPAELATFKGRLAVVVAENDEVLSAEQGRRVHAAYPGQKLLIMLPGATHNNFPIQSTAEWYRQASEYILGRSK